MGIDPTDPSQPASAGSVPASDLSVPLDPGTSAVRALPANSGSSPGGIDVGTNKRFYTISASLRETYDENVGTTNSNQQSSLETEISPSVLVSFPTDEGNFLARYTFGMTYYSNSAQQSGGGNTDTLELNHEISAQYTRTISERFSISLQDLFRYTTEPSLDQNTGSVFREGPYFNNSFNAGLSAQWTPLFSTSTTYNNTYVGYQDSTVGEVQDYVENTGSHSFYYAFFPKLSGSVGGIVDIVDYKDNIRGYSNYTLFGGGQWEALPSLSLSGRGGASYTETRQNITSITPYAALSLSWRIGERSTFSLNYSHEITPSSQFGAQGESSDRLNVGLSYDISPRLTAHLAAAVDRSVVSNSLTTVQGAPVSTNETVYYVDSSLSYQFDKYASISVGTTESANDSGQSDRNYTRLEFYAGIRGTY